MTTAAPRCRHCGVKVENQPGYGWTHALGGYQPCNPQQPATSTRAEPLTVAPPPLTDQHVRILTHIAQGADRATTARHIGIALVTLDNHLKRIRIRLGATNLPHAVALAVAAGTLPVDVAAGTEVAR